MAPNRLKIILCLFFFFSAFECSFAQQGGGSGKKQRSIDSLLKVLAISKEDTNKVITLNSLSNQSQQSGKFENALKYANEAFSLSQKLDFKKGIAKSLYMIGNAYKSNNDFTSALDYYLKSLKVCEENSDKKMKASVLVLLGNLYRSQGNYSKSLENFKESLKIREEIGDIKEMATPLNGIGNAYYEEGIYPKALEYYLKSLKISDAMGDKKEQASTLNNLGNVYKVQNNIGKALEYYNKALSMNEETGNKKWKAINLNNIGGIYISLKNTKKAIECFEESVKIKEEINDKFGMAFSLMNIGVIFMNEANFKKGIEYQERSLKLREEIGDKGGIAESLRNLGVCYYNLGQNQKALEYLNRALKLGDETRAKESIKNCYSDLAKLHEKMNNTKKAYEYYKLYSAVKDSLLNDESSENMTRMNVQFDTEKKDNEIKLLNKDKEKQEALTASEKKKQNIITGSVTLVLVLVMVFALFVFRSNLQKQKANVEISKQKEIIEEKNKEMHDSITYALRIQTAILPPEKLIKQHLPDSFILFKPKDIVSGDFYWVEKLGNKVLFAAVDCTGHGVPGAMVSVVGHNALDRTIKEFDLSQPGAILDKLTVLVEETFEGSENEVKDGMDISLCSFDTNSLKLEWAGANNPLWIMENNEIKEIKANKQPIGKFINRNPFNNHVLQLQKGQCLYIFTDGFADQFGGPKGKKFKYKQLQEILIGISGLPMEKQKQVIENKFNEWKGDLTQVDDVLVIGVRV